MSKDRKYRDERRMFFVCDAMLVPRRWKNRANKKKIVHPRCKEEEIPLGKPRATLDKSTSPSYVAPFEGTQP